MDENKLIAVVGVSCDPAKFGYKIFTDLLGAGFKVVAVGVRGGIVAGHTVYKSLKDLPNKPDIVVTVVPPLGTDKTIDEVISLGIKEIWMQPGSVLKEAVEKAKLAGIKVTDQGCFMVAHGVW
ncbi:MAG: CoA-binding protein [Endomicrobium sp.]|jgi:predicted CoA-binding protein|uniref:CoA-binding protein n=1 Tax=Candidatus Endomicrobiellum cubanum TaxID=3242325 RepID=UPI002831EFEB|nr:CoA-binding protein [Endomicrobium sp.]